MEDSSVVQCCLEAHRGRLLSSRSRKITIVASLWGRCPACMFKSFFILLFDIYARILSNVARLNFFPKLCFIAFSPDLSVHAIF